MAKEPEPVLTAYYSLCTADCEGNYHVPEYKTCDRCGALIHKRIFEVDHPTLGEVVVGSECFKDVMGYAWKKSHDNAVALHRAIVGWVKRWDTSTGRSTPYVVVRYREGKRATFEIPGTLEALGYHKLWSAKFPHGFNDRIIRAGADLGLWEAEEQARYGPSDRIGVRVDLTRVYDPEPEERAG